MADTHPKDGSRWCTTCEGFHHHTYNGTQVVEAACFGPQHTGMCEARYVTCTQCGSTGLKRGRDRPDLTEDDHGVVVDRREWSGRK